MLTSREKPSVRNGKPGKKDGVVIPVRFGTMTTGGRFVALPVTILRSDVDLGTAGDYLCSRRLTGSILARPAGSSGQQSGIPGLDDDADTLLEALFAVGGFTVSRTKINTKLTFPIPAGSREQSKLFHFANRCGLLTITAAEDLVAVEEAVKAAASTPAG